MFPQGEFHLDSAQVSSFRSSYQHNNKKGGHKNLRCFPHCYNGVHMENGFCGAPVHAIFESTKQMPQLHIYAHFLPLLDSGGALWHTFDILPESTDTSWFTGTCTLIDEAQSQLQVSINHELKGWHYGWTSKRHTSVTQHVLCIYGVVRMPDQTFYCVHRIHSPPFRIISGRRAKSIERRLRLTHPSKIHRLLVPTPHLDSPGENSSIIQQLVDDEQFSDIFPCNGIAYNIHDLWSYNLLWKGNALGGGGQLELLDR